jgi:hypothetical protein
MDSISWDASWPVVASTSMGLDPAEPFSVNNDTPTVWCAQTTPVGGVAAFGYGTPGTPNDACP